MAVTHPALSSQPLGDKPQAARTEVVSATWKEKCFACSAAKQEKVTGFLLTVAVLGDNRVFVFLSAGGSLTH